MSLYGTKATSARTGPKPVWPYFAMSVTAVIVALIGCAVYWPRSVPAKEDLVMTGGEMRTFMIRDDISNTGAGAMLPILNSAYIRFKGIEGEFRYPWTFPKYFLVKDYTAVYVDIWVEKEALGRDEAPIIWALEEKNHFKEAERQTIVLYEEVLENQKENGIALIKFSLFMALCSLVFAFIGIGVGRWNRKKYPGYYPGR